MNNISTIYTMDINNILKKLDTDSQNGLSSSQVEKLQHKYGLNSLKSTKSKSIIQRFLNQFKDILIIILLIAAVVSFAIACSKGEFEEFFESALILIIVVLNAIIGVFQEKKAENALESLKKLSTPKAKVIRNSIESIIDAKFLVPGDIIKLEAGDYVPADARIIVSSQLKSEESALTGESVPSEKFADAKLADNAAIGDRKNMLFSGCPITCGTATAVVVSTGMDTEIGKIAKLIQDEKETQTPLQRKLADLGKKLGLIALISCFIIFFIGLINGMAWLDIFMISVSLAVSAIPEGMPATITVILSIGILHMARKNAIIKSLPAVETLGSASVICSDKTGTLTQNRMTLTNLYIDGMENAESISNISSNSNSLDNEEIKNLLFYASLCSNASINKENGKEIHIGDPTETAIVAEAVKLNLDQDIQKSKQQRSLELPFDSNRKLMSVINTINGKKILITKGAVDMLLPKCVTGNISKAADINETLSKQALRVIAVACKELDSDLQTEDLVLEKLESNLKFMGLIAMIDPPREEAKSAVELCKKAGIKPVMITGDHISTASAIAEKLGIFTKGSRAITGAELDSMSDEKLSNIVEDISVYARVSPENKIRVVKAFQSKGEVVAMTGDGVNDAPALKAADIGCAMGKSGTDVAKESADMVLSDDNFATIVHAVKEGRGIFSNLKKIIAFLLASNSGEILVVLFAMLFWRKSPLLSMQLLWINTVTDSFPAIALGMEAAEENIMDRKPHKKNENIFANGLGAQIIFCGIMFTVITLFAFYLGNSIVGSLSAGRTMAFLVLSMSEIVHAFNMRSSRSIFKVGIWGNKKLNFAACISTILVILVTFTPLSKIFGLVSLPFWLYVVSFLLILSPILVLEIYKALFKQDVLY